MSEEEPLFCMICGAEDRKIYSGDSPDYERCGHEWDEIDPHNFCGMCGSMLKYPSKECHDNCWEATHALCIEHECENINCSIEWSLNS